jgi:hypothetical protein
VIVLDRDLPVVHGDRVCRTVMHGVHGHPRLAQPLSDPVGQRRVVLGYQHPHPAIMRRRA